MFAATDCSVSLKSSIPPFALAVAVGILAELKVPEVTIPASAVTFARTREELITT